MPLTPFHFGPGALVSAATGSKVSFLAFTAANVLIDVESLYNMVTNQPRIHTFFHTYVGSTLAAVLIVLGFLPLRHMAFRLPAWPVLGWRNLGARAVLLGSILGAWSHVLMDSIMHADITPLAPVSNANALYRVVSLGALHAFCVGTGILGILWYLLRSSLPQRP